jgi:hypothetical protein
MQHNTILYIIYIMYNTVEARHRGIVCVPRVCINSETPLVVPVFMYSYKSIRVIVLTDILIDVEL